jgi:tetratricopeptide (TPR) repeat protein
VAVESVDRVGRPEDELPLRRQQLDACRRDLGPDDPETVQAELNLARHLVELHRSEEADALLQHVVSIRTAELGSDNPETVLALALSANVAKKLGRFEEARELHLQLLKWVESQDSAQPADLAVVLMQTGHLLQQWREREQAAEFYQRALDLRRDALGPDDPNTLNSQRWLAFAMYLIGHADTARELAEDAGERYHRTLGAEATETLQVRDLLAKMSERG